MKLPEILVLATVVCVGSCKKEASPVQLPPGSVEARYEVAPKAGDYKVDSIVVHYLQKDGTMAFQKGTGQVLVLPSTVYKAGDSLYATFKLYGIKQNPYAQSLFIQLVKTADRQPVWGTTGSSYNGDTSTPYCVRGEVYGRVETE
jgi:hypothetical protein